MSITYLKERKMPAPENVFERCDLVSVKSQPGRWWIFAGVSGSPVYQVQQLDDSAVREFVNATNLTLIAKAKGIGAFRCGA